jgi:flagellar biosynthesis/type III secretory pathway protein FliH
MSEADAAYQQGYTRGYERAMATVRHLYDEGYRTGFLDGMEKMREFFQTEMDLARAKRPIIISMPKPEDL